MKTALQREIRNFLDEYEKRPDIETKWGRPQVGFADANSPYIRGLKDVIAPTHSLPEDVLKGAKIVVVYYTPFTSELAKTNLPGELLASKEWARTYEETNAMFGPLTQHLIAYLEKAGYRGAVSPETQTFDREKCISNWSHRHFAYAAGLGTFGANNMLLTREGTCGRFFSFVTDLDVVPDSPMEEELCLHKKNGSCGICFKNCPTEALRADTYDRMKCFALIEKNAEVHKEFGCSYDCEENTGTQVCGKCITYSPCAFWNEK